MFCLDQRPTQSCATVLLRGVVLVRRLTLVRLIENLVF
jgi:hypothetical protein